MVTQSSKPTQQIHADPSRIAQSSRDPGPFRRWMMSRLLWRQADPNRRRALLASQNKQLRAEAAPGLHFFHQPGEPHSELALQALPKIAARYGLTPQLHLVPGPSGANNPEPELLPLMAANDARRVAPYYGLQTDANGDLPLSPVSEPEAGAELQRSLGHYGSGMFYLGGVWYWGVDRLCHLEARLRELGFDTQPDEPFCFARPSEQVAEGAGRGLTLEFYGSLRSPYTAIAWPRARALCEKSGVQLALKPVLPMVMRGAPVSRVKGFYIFGDTAREAELHGQRFGPFYDPIGEPVKRAYRLLPALRASGQFDDFYGAFLRAAFQEGRNLSTRRGFCRLLKDCGLDKSLWQQASANRAMPEEIENNRLAMYALPSWGVPTIRLLDEQGEELFHAFGQDRLWLVARYLEQRVPG